MRVETFLRDSARRFPDKAALIVADRRLTFAEIDRKSDRLAAFLRAKGIKRGDRVVIFMDNCWEAVVALFGALKAGCAFSQINPSTKADKLAHGRRRARARELARGLGLPAERVLVTSAERGLGIAELWRALDAQP